MRDEQYKVQFDHYVDYTDEALQHMLKEELTTHKSEHLWNPMPGAFKEFVEKMASIITRKPTKEEEIRNMGTPKQVKGGATKLLSDGIIQAVLANSVGKENQTVNEKFA